MIIHACGVLCIAVAIVLAVWTVLRRTPPGEATIDLFLATIALGFMALGVWTVGFPAANLAAVLVVTLTGVLMIAWTVTRERPTEDTR